MSITPATPQSGDPDPPIKESAIIRRWLWQQTKQAVRLLCLFGLGMLLGAGLADQGAEMMKLKEVIQAQNVVIQAQREEQARYVTVLLEEDQGGQLIFGGLALLLGVPTGVTNIVQGLQGAQPRWVLPGKLQPRSPKEKAMFLYVDTKTGAREGPFAAPVLIAPETPK